MKPRANSPWRKIRAVPKPVAGRRGFTLAEVLAALTLMAIVVPVAMEGVSVASRAGTLGHRKAAAARVAQRVLNEALLTGQLSSSTAGTTSEGETSYEWKLQTSPWSVDALEVVTVDVSFSIQGSTYDVRVSTLHDPNASTGAAVSL